MISLTVPTFHIQLDYLRYRHSIFLLIISCPLFHSFVSNFHIFSLISYQSLVFLRINFISHFCQVFGPKFTLSYKAMVAFLWLFLLRYIVRFEIKAFQFILRFDIGQALYKIIYHFLGPLSISPGFFLSLAQLPLTWNYVFR